MAFSLNQCFGCVRVWSEALVESFSSLRPYEMVELNWRSVVTQNQKWGLYRVLVQNVDLSAVVLAMSITV